MTSAPRHMIHKQHLHVNFHGGVAAAGLQGMLGQWMKDNLLPAMEKVLDEQDIPSSRLRINEIKIDAGDITGNDWPAQLTDKICRELKRQLKEMAVLPEAMGREEIALEMALETGGYDAESQQKILLHYLRTGTLPWYAQQLEGTQVLAWLQQQLGKGFFQNSDGIHFLKQHPVALERLLMQSSAATLESWMLQWDQPEYQQVFPGILRMAKQWFKQQHTVLAWSYALLFEKWTTGFITSNTPLWEKWVEEKLPHADVIIKATQEWLTGKMPVNTWQSRTDVNNIEHASDVDAASPGDGQEMDKKTGSETFLPGGGKKMDKKPAAETLPGDAEYFIHNAGLIIVHPFLTTWFTMLGLWQNNQWTDDAAQSRAVLLLHYLAGSELEVAEYALPLCKLLTGYPLDKPVAALLDITEEEITEARALLTEVTAQWSMLKNTSVEGLQQSFLQREGKLSHRDNGWHLQVEQKAYDVLLQHLPWTIGIVKSNRMTETLFTTWI